MTKPPRAVLVSQWFPPEPVRIPIDIAAALRSHGFCVEVMTGIPNFPSGVVQEGFSSWKPTRSVIDGFNVYRYPLFPSHDASALRRIINYATWAISSTLLGARVLRRADVALIYSSPATAAMAPSVWTRVLGTPFVLLIQDVWPDSITATGLVKSRSMGRFLERAVGLYVDWVYRRANHIAVISPGMVKLLNERGVPLSRLSVVYNWADEGAPTVRKPRDAIRAQLGIAPDEFVVTYAGTHGPAQGLERLVRAAHAMLDQPGVRFLMVGDGIEVEHLRALAAELECENITFVGPVPPGRMPEIQAASDVQIVALIDHDLFSVTMPSKVQAILAAGKPVIVLGSGDAAAVVRTAGAGWVVAPHDRSGLIRALREASETPSQVLDRMGDAGKSYYSENMSRAIGGRRLATVLRSALADHNNLRTDSCIDDI